MNDELRDRRVAHALADMAAGQATGLGDLFDLLGDAVYRLSQTLTHDEEAAEDAAVETFRRLWERVPRHLANGTETRWVLDVACDVACGVRQASEYRNRDSDATLAARRVNQLAQGIQVPVHHRGTPPSGTRADRVDG